MQIRCGRLVFDGSIGRRRDRERFLGTWTTPGDGAFSAKALASECLPSGYGLGLRNPNRSNTQRRQNKSDARPFVVLRERNTPLARDLKSLAAEDKVRKLEEFAAFGRRQSLTTVLGFDNSFDNNGGGCPCLRRHAEDDSANRITGAPA